MSDCQLYQRALSKRNGSPFERKPSLARKRHGLHGVSGSVHITIKCPAAVLQTSLRDVIFPVAFRFIQDRLFTDCCSCTNDYGRFPLGTIFMGLQSFLLLLKAASSSLLPICNVFKVNEASFAFLFIDAKIEY
ncbi:hypothetical protein Tcan_00364 [Toxocara canis]|uniref:Uncharacterized protein n=1 Tax=Toxocara canis TaxID=6265 RepID=A0A0B2VJF2_TOXCA|nr:hypothetical protein Tcan_00364 [Toxocara canis]